MCGIVGWLGDPNQEEVTQMRDQLSYRGPDDAGLWSEQGVCLGHRRLSILDLSSSGHQPMVSPSGRYVVAFNGEIFNHLKIREALAADFTFRGGSDTETMLAAVENWGLEASVRRFIGMFAIALFDRETRTLHLVRDRMGIKPLYYACSGGQLAFASELRPFRKLHWVDREIDIDAVDAYLRHLCVPAPLSIIRGVRKLPPGQILEWKVGDTEPSLSTYWSIREQIDVARCNPFTGSFSNAVTELDGLLKDSVQLRTLSDVPIGAFLSGGIDSSAVAAVMQSLAPTPIHTFSIGFEDAPDDESAHARRIARHLGTIHHEKILSARDALDLAPLIAARYDEPFADGSSLPTLLLSRFAREQVTVALSGDGGDELFGGYPRYFWAKRIERFQKVLTRPGSMLAASILQHLPLSIIDHPRVGGRLRGLAAPGKLGTRVHRFAEYLRSERDQVFDEVISAWKRTDAVLAAPPSKKAGPSPALFDDLSWPRQMMAVDQNCYLPDDILTKVDRASMAVSLEARVPILDHRVVEWTWRLPSSYLMADRGDRGKLLLREVLYRYVPRELVDRPKTGFGMPLELWLRTDLRDWAESLLQPSVLKTHTPFLPQAIADAWKSHLAGENRLSEIWPILMYVEWAKSWA